MAFDFFGWFSRAITPDRFAKLVLKTLKQSGLEDPVQYDQKAFVLRSGDLRLYLGNAHAQYCHANTDSLRQAILMNITGPFLDRRETPLTRAAAEEMVVAVVRERALFSLGTLYWKIDDLTSKEANVAFEPISEWYCRSLVLDFPTHVRMIGHDDLAQWGITFDELFAVGLAKLTDCTKPKFRAENGYFVGEWKDDYDNSRILLQTLFDDLPIERQPVFVTPNRLTLLVADSANPSAVKAMLARAEEIIREEPRRFNPSPLWYRDGVLQEFTVAADSPIYHEVQRATRMAALGYYDEQKHRLEELYEKTGKDHFVASYNLLKEQDGSYFSCAQWTKGVSTLLPKADRVILYDPDQPGGGGIVADVPWDRCAAVAESLMLDTEMFPARFYVSRFPTEEQIRAMIS